MQKTLIGLLLLAQGTACTPDAVNMAEDALKKAQQTTASPSAQPSGTPGTQPSAAASAAPTTGVTGVSAAAMADPYAVGRKWTYRYTTKAAGNTDISTYTIDFLKQDGKVTSLRGTLVDAAGKQTYKEDGQSEPTPDGRPFLWAAIKDAPYVNWAPTGDGHTTAPDTVTVPAGTFETTKTMVRTQNVLGSYTIDAWVSPKLGLVKYDGTTVFNNAGPVQLTIELVSVQ